MDFSYSRKSPKKDELPQLGGNTAQFPPRLKHARQRRHGIWYAKMLDKTSSIICAFGLASAALLAVSALRIMRHCLRTFQIRFGNSP